VIKQHAGGGDLAADALDDGCPVFGGKGGVGGVGVFGLGCAERYFVCFCFIDAFCQVREWFGDYSEQFLKESRQLLQQANDLKQV